MTEQQIQSKKIKELEAQLAEAKPEPDSKDEAGQEAA